MYLIEEIIIWINSIGARLGVVCWSAVRCGDLKKVRPLVQILRIRLQAQPGPCDRLMNNNSRCFMFLPFRAYFFDNKWSFSFNSIFYESFFLRSFFCGIGSKRQINSACAFCYDAIVMRHVRARHFPQWIRVATIMSVDLVRLSWG